MESETKVQTKHKPKPKNLKAKVKKIKILQKPQLSETKISVTIQVQMPPLKPPAFRTQSSNDCIQYSLYPWEQGQEFRLETLFPSVVVRSAEKTHFKTLKTFLKSTSLKTLQTETCKISWANADLDGTWYWKEKNLHIALGTIQSYPSKPRGCVFYIVQREKSLLSCLIDQSFELQAGDGGTHASANEDSFFIENVGDVSSLVKIYCVC